MLADKNIHSVTMLRGIASLAVCLGHFLGTLNTTSIVQFGKFGGYGVPIFFAITGFIIPYSLYQSNYTIKNYFKFLIKRITRLDPPYLLSILGIFLLSYIAQLSPFSEGNLIEIVTEKTALHIFYLVKIADQDWFNPVFWTLAIEFQFYLLIGLLFPLLTIKKWVVQVLFFSTFCLIPFVLNDDTFVTDYFIMFLPGVLLFWFFTKQMSRNLFLGLTTVLLVLGYFKGGFQTPICAIIAIGFILFVKKPIKPLIFLGTISYSLYLIHTPFGTDGMINFLQNYLETEVERAGLLFLCLPITVLASWMFYRIIEKPSMKWSKKLNYSEEI